MCRETLTEIRCRRYALHTAGFCLFVLLVATWPVEGGAAFGPLSIRQGNFYRYTTPVELWGVNFSRGLESDDIAGAIVDNLAHYAEYGINSVGLTLQREGVPAFSRDGKEFDRKTVRRLRRVINETSVRWMPTVITVFSPDRSAWLAAPESYHNALKLLTRACARVGDAIFLLGATTTVPAGCPIRLDDVETLLELCQTVKDTNPRQVVGILARSADAVDKVSGSRVADVVFVCDTASLARARELKKAGMEKPVVWIEQEGTPDDFAKLAAQVSTVVNEPGVYLIAGFYSPAADEGILRRFLEHVRATRLAASIRAEARANPAANVLTEEERREGWVALFDGETFNGWIPLARDWGAWSVEDGALYCSRGSGRRWLRTEKRYKDFVLRLQFKLSRNCNSGVFIHAPLDARASRIGMEIQLRDQRKPTVDADSLGAIYSVLPPRVYAGRPAGEWNDLEVMCEGKHVVVKLNGQEIQNFTMDDHPLLQGRLSEGYIGLQDHGAPVWFRNIRLKELNGQS